MSKKEHKLRARAAASDSLLLERKIKPDGTVQEFPLELLGRADSAVAGRYRIPPHGTVGARLPFSLPEGACSDGYFWSDRPYCVYRFRAPAGEPLGHRVDAVADVRLGSDTVTYRDLALDWWVLPGGTALEEDLEEFEELAAAGVLTAGDVAEALRARRAVMGEWSAILTAVEALEARWASGV